MTAPMMPIKRAPWRPRPQVDKQGTDDFNHSDQIRKALKAEDSIEPEHQRTVRHQRLDALRLASCEFENTNQQQCDYESVARDVDTHSLQRGSGLGVYQRSYQRSLCAQELISCIHMPFPRFYLCDKQHFRRRQSVTHFQLSDGSPDFSGRATI